MDKNILAQNFTTKSILKYTLPTILMTLFMSSYMIVDGIFVSNLVGEDALSAVNVVIPALSVVLAVGMMFGTGGVAIIGRFMGQNKYEEARGFLTTLYIIGGGLGIVFTILGYVFSDTIVIALGANELLLPYAQDYFMSLLPFLVPTIFQVFVQTFFVTAGKPELGFIICVLGGFTNMVLDYILIAPHLFDLGITGAGLATGLGSSVPGLFGLLYFMFHKKGNLYFTKPLWNLKIITQSMYNGMSEMVSNLSTAITTMMFNIIMLKLVGNSGVAAISVILYIQMFQMAIYMGYSFGVAPLLSYKYGEQNHEQLEKIVKTSLKVTGIISIAVVGLSWCFADLAISVFIAPESETFVLAKQGLMIFSIAYLFMGINVFVSAMFTALSNGKVSAILAICRTLVFTVVSLILLPKAFGIIGVWIAVPVAEALTLLCSIYFYKKNKSIYHY